MLVVSEFGEVWRDVVGYEGYYQVSDHGRVARVRKPKKDVLERKRIKLLKYGYNEQGRRSVGLCVGGKVKRFQVHVLVLEAFVGPRPEGMQGRHLDGDYLNNNDFNLAWGLRSENMVRNGTSNQGVKHKLAKLRERDVVAIRKSDLGNYVLAKKYGVTGACIYAIRKGLSWKHV